MLGDLVIVRMFLELFRVDVFPPDAEYCGDIGGHVRVASVATAFGSLVAPHDASGSVARLPRRMPR